MSGVESNQCLHTRNSRIKSHFSIITTHLLFGFITWHLTIFWIVPVDAVVPCNDRLRQLRSAYRAKGVTREQSYIKSQGIIKLIPTGSDPPTMCLSLCFQDSGV